MIEERLLGFDVRDLSRQSEELWDEARWEKVLLGLDTARPIRQSSREGLTMAVVVAKLH